MKKVILSVLFLAALTGCSNEGNEIPGTEKQVPVVLSAGTPGITATPHSRGVIETGNTFTAAIAGWETSGAVDYTAADNWLSTAEIMANPTAQAVSLTPGQVYNPDNDVKTHIRAWHPQGTLSDGQVSFENKKGTVDAMLAAPVTGSKNDNTGKVLNFAHKTTQLKFKIIADASWTAGTTLEGITVSGAEIPTGFDLAANAVTYAAAAPLAVPGITGQSITGTALSVGEPVMIRPMTGNRVTLDIQTSDAEFTGVVATIKDDANFKEGKAYTITLTFKQQGIGLSATVTEWTEGSGSADVE